MNVFSFFLSKKLRNSKDDNAWVYLSSKSIPTNFAQKNIMILCVMEFRRTFFVLNLKTYN